MTDAERRLLWATICLHGFSLYERFDNAGVWRPLLVGAFVENNPQPLYEMIEEYKQGDIATRRAKTPLSSKWQHKKWFELTDYQLTAFHRTVVSTS